MKTPEEYAEMIEPCGPRILVKRLKSDRIDGIYLPGSSEDTGTEAVVMAISKDLDLPINEASIRLGSRIYISRFTGVPIPTDGTDDNRLWFVKYEDILGILLPPPPPPPPTDERNEEFLRSVGGRL